MRGFEDGDRGYLSANCRVISWAKSPGVCDGDDVTEEAIAQFKHALL
ncbi:hypothetical protein [Spirulina sp. 06S082]|nr:hypothetical protein [Spirulina sp. 06S082]MEA5472582.1 hypothetical protein [Spirulina sp. 06S082]